MSSRELLIFLLMCIVWGLHFVVVKIAVSEIPPIFYAAIRMTLVALLMSPFLRWRRTSMARVFGAAACLGSLNYAFMFTGISLGSASVAAIALELYVPFATILSVIVLKEKIGWQRIVGIALAFLGVGVIATGDAQGGVTIGVIFIVAAAFIEAVGAILVKTVRDFKPHELLAWFGLAGCVVLWTATLIFEHGHITALQNSDVLEVVGAVFYSAVVASIFGHTAYYWLIQRLPVSIVAPSALLATMFAVIFSVILLGDPVTATLVIGGSMTIGGVGFVLFRSAARGAPKSATGRQAPFLEAKED